MSLSSICPDLCQCCLLFLSAYIPVFLCVCSHLRQFQIWFVTGSVVSVKPSEEANPIMLPPSCLCMFVFLCVCSSLPRSQNNYVSGSTTLYLKRPTLSSCPHMFVFLCICSCWCQVRINMIYVWVSCLCHLAWRLSSHNTTFFESIHCLCVCLSVCLSLSSQNKDASGFVIITPSEETLWCHLIPVYVSVSLFVTIFTTHSKCLT